MSKRKNGFILFLILVLCLILLSQLMGDTMQLEPGNSAVPEATGLMAPPDHAAAAEPVELNAVVFMSPEEAQLLQFWNRQYELEHPGTTVNIVNMAKQEALQYLLEQAEAGASPDIMLLDNLWVHYFAALGLLSHAADAASIEGRPALPQTESRLLWNGYVWAVPRDMDPYVAAVNMTLLEAAGMPSLPEDADGWRSVYRELAKLEIDAGIGFDPEDPGALISVVRGLGGDWTFGDSGMIQIGAEGGRDLERMLGFPADEEEGGPQQPMLRAVRSGDGEIWRDFGEGRYLALITPLSGWLRAGAPEAYLTAALTEGSAGKIWAGNELRRLLIFPSCRRSLCLDFGHDRDGTAVAMAGGDGRLAALSAGARIRGGSLLAPVGEHRGGRGCLAARAPRGSAACCQA